MKKDIIIFSRKLANELIQSKKFELVGIGSNNQFPMSTVFYFERTKKLEMYLETVHDIKVD